MVMKSASSDKSYSETQQVGEVAHECSKNSISSKMSLAIIVYC